MYDLILRGGTVVDGKRSQPYAADICIREGRIARIAPEGGEEAREVVDVSGLAVAPGFIAIVYHSLPRRTTHSNAVLHKIHPTNAKTARLNGEHQAGCLLTIPRFPGPL